MSVKICTNVIGHFLIRSANPKSWPVVITFRSSPLFKIEQTKQFLSENFTTGRTGPAEGIIDDTCLLLTVSHISRQLLQCIEHRVHF